MTELLIGLSGVVVGFMLQALNGWLTERRAEAREHRQWLRDRQFEAFTAFAQEVQRIFVRTTVPSASPQDAATLIASFTAAYAKAGALVQADSTLFNMLSRMYNAAIDLLGQDGPEDAEERFARAQVEYRNAMQEHFRR